MTIVQSTSNGSSALDLDKFFFGDAFKEPHYISTKTHRFPPMEVSECEDAFYLSAELPGLTSEDVEVFFEKGSVVISGHRKRPEGNTAHRVRLAEIPYGEFSRKIQLPVSADSERITAEMQNGLLSVVVQKKAESKPRRIEVS